MKVETYECDETATEHVECADEAIKLIEELGLTGQKSLLHPQKKTRSPYRQMTKDEFFVFKQICPEETDVTRFNEEPMPLRVLQVASHAKSTGMFDRLVVWHRESAAVKDPVLVGEKDVQSSPANGYTSKEFYILARWGDALDEWPAVIKTAMAIWREKNTAKLEEVIAQAKADLSAVATAGMSYAIKKPTPYYSW